MSYFWPLDRDRDRLEACVKRASNSPLGSGALAGNPFAIDRAALADTLRLNGVAPNSLDAVSDRDHLAEFLFCAALTGLHLSRLAEDLIIYSSPPYGFGTLDERYTTGSSLMPQKRNPDSLELARGKSGRLVGNLNTLLTVLKGLPSTYNKDLQEDKEPVFDSYDTLMIVLPVVTGVIETLTPNLDAMRAALDPAMLATDLADYLVQKGMPFREAHGVVGRLVRESEERGVLLADLPLEVMRSASGLVEADVSAVFDFERSVARRRVSGGTAPEAVRKQIAEARRSLKAVSE
jgi:argininosuccinate lyase